MKKAFAVLLLVVLLSITSLPALASRSWCATDPIVHLPALQVHTVTVPVLDEGVVAVIAKTQGEYEVRLYGKLDGHKLPTQEFPVDLLPEAMRGLLEYSHGAWTW